MAAPIGRLILTRALRRRLKPSLAGIVGGTGHTFPGASILGLDTFPPVPLRIGSIPLLHRVPSDDVRLSRFTEILSSCFNSLAAQGFIKQTGPSTYTLSAAATGVITLAGDVNGSGSGTIPTALANIIAAGGPVGDSTHTPVITWDSKGRLLVVGSAAIGGGSLVNTVSNSDGTLTIAPTTGNVVASLNPAHANTWSGQQTFTAATELFQPVAQNTGNASNFVFTGAADTNLTASTERIAVNWNLARTVNFATGSFSLQREVVIQAPTYDFVGASTINTAITFEVSGSPIPSLTASITQTVAMRVKTGQAAGKGIIIAAAATPTNNLLELQDSGGNTLANLNSSGRLGIGPAAQGANTSTYGIIVQTGIANERIQITGSASSGFYITNAGVTDGATVRYDSTNGYEHFVSNSLEVMQFTITNGLCGLGNATRTGGGAPTAQLHVWGNASGNVVLLVQGASGQSVDLQDWKDNSGNLLSAVLKTGDITTQKAGVGYQVKEGSNAKMGTTTLSAGTKVVSTTAVNANSRIFLQNMSGTTNAGVLTVSAIVAGTSFTITSTNGADANTVAWIIFDPA